MAGMRQVVDISVFNPLPDPLWAAAEHPPAGDPHWQQGVTWQEWCGGAGTTYDECLAVTGTGGAPAAASALTPNATQTNRGATPFTVYAMFECSPVGQDLALDKAEQALARREPYLVSRTFWTGSAGTSGSAAQTTAWPHLASDTTLDDPSGIRLQTAASPLVTGGADVATALGSLEAALAVCYGGQGVIHVPLAALPTFAAENLAQEGPDGRLYTPSGNLLVAGAGYTGSAPSGAAPAADTYWIYATGAMFGYRSDVFVREMPDTFDRSKNTVKMIASRTYLFGFECCHLAALVNVGVPT